MVTINLNVFSIKHLRTYTYIYLTNSNKTYNCTEMTVE